MRNFKRIIPAALCLLVLTLGAAHAQETAKSRDAAASPEAAVKSGHQLSVSKEQIKGLDEQVQEIKGDVLGIAAELSLLEEKLLFPSNTQVAIFVSLQAGETFRLDSVEILLDGKPAAQHIYTFKELEALRKGGVQRIYTGNITTGGHDLRVAVLGKSESGEDFRTDGQFNVQKDVGPKIVEISLARQTLAFKDR